MDEALNEAKNEYRRAEHLFFVSLKYTRTADMLRIVIERFISSFEFGIDCLLEHAKKEKKIKEIPKAPRAKSDIIKEIFPDDEALLNFIEFYILLRDLRAAPYTKREEYRRHVTMVSELSPGKFIEINIDVLGDYLKKTHAFIEYVSEKIK